MMNGRITRASLLAVSAAASLVVGSIAVAQDAPAGSQTTPTTRRTWELTPDNRLQPVAPAPPGVTRAKEGKPEGLDELNAIDAQLAQKQYSAAFDRLVPWLKAHPTSSIRDRALLMTADALQASGQGIKAFYYCDELLDRHPDSAYYQAALQKQYAIADTYLNGKKDSWLFLPIAGRQDEALEMLFRIQNRSPGSPVSENAMLRSADHYWANGDWDYAADAYSAYARTYPRSPRAKQAQLREAYSNLAQVRGPNFDPTPILNARATLRQLEATDPELFKGENLAEKIILADRFLARRVFLSADYYKRVGKPDAAAHLYQRVVELYPTTPEADDARNALQKLGK
jgi:outer membrane assembly lipoprotein YfiO